MTFNRLRVPTAASPDAGMRVSKASPPPAPAPRPSPNPSKADTRENLNTTYGAPKE